MFSFFTILLAQTPTWQIFNTSNSDLPSNYFTRAYQSPNGDIWFSTENSGIVKLSNGIFTTYNTSNSNIPSNLVRDLKVTLDGVLWIGSTAGLSKFENGIWTNYYFPSSTVYSIETDNYGSLWVGSAQNGLYKFHNNTWINYNTSNSGLSSNYISDILFDSNNKLYASCFGGGLSIFDGISWQVYNTSNSNIISDNSWDIYKDSNNQIWVLSNQGISTLINNSWITYNCNNSSFPGYDYRAVYEYGHIKLFGSWTNGLVQIINNEFVNYTINNSPLLSNKINLECIQQLSNNSFIIATWGGGIYKITYPQSTLNSDFTINYIPNTSNSVQFTNTSVGQFTHCLWDFNNDGINDSNELNPIFIYNQSGLYSVKLTVFNDFETDSETKYSFVNTLDPTYPPWTSPVIYPESMSVISNVFIGNEPADNGDLIAAFELINNVEVIRGLGQIFNDGTNGISSFLIYLETPGNQVYFKVWDSSNNIIYSSIETLTLNPNEIVGSYPDSLFSIHGYIDNPQIINLSDGWNLISINRNLINYDINILFDDILENVIQIKNFNSLFIPGYNHNTLTKISNELGYWVKMSVDDSLLVYGDICSNTTTHLNIGWNLVGYPLALSLDPAMVLSSIINNVEIVKGLDGIYIPNNPLNTLNLFEPGKGYWIKVTEECDLQYTLPNKILLNKYTKDYNNIVFKPYSMVVTFKLLGQNFLDSDKIKAFCNSELRGSTSIKQINGSYYALLQIFSEIENENIIFTIERNGIDYPIEYSINSLINTSLGDFHNNDFIELTVLNNDFDNVSILKSSIISIYPNPFNPSTNIKYNLNSDSNVKISIYDVKGRLVNLIVDEDKPKGEYEIVWNGENQDNQVMPSGIYFCRLKTNVGVSLKKISIIK